MANPEHLAMLERGVAEWNRWVEEAKITPDLSHADLRDLNLDDLNLIKADLQFAIFTGVSLVGANLDTANLRAAFFVDCNLRDAHLYFVTFTDAVLDRTDFTGSNCGGTTWGNVDLSTTIGLENVNHLFPSTLGVDTVFRSRGNIPGDFLRGCGSPESFITQMRVLVGTEDGMHFYSCFISYSGKDEEFARRLRGKMRDAHLRVWFAPEDVKGGEKLDEQLETHIRVFDKLLIVLSENSLRSPWVMRELRKAFKAEREAKEAGRPKRKLFPVRLCSYEALQDWVCNDSRSGEDLAEEVRQYFIPDFSEWKDHEQFGSAFARFLSDLKDPISHEAAGTSARG